MKPLLLICGPTACHKSETALRIAEKWGGEILSIDSVAVYRGMDIGSAKPDPAERQRVPHHLIDIVDPNDTSFSVAAFQQAADEVLRDLDRRNVQPILVGGSGLYCDAVLEDMGYALPSRSGWSEPGRCYCSVASPFLLSIRRIWRPSETAAIRSSASA